MKVLFLDIDGVLNSANWQEQCRVDDPVREGFFERNGNKLDPQAVARLNKIIEATDCSVVISSTKRISHKIGEINKFLCAAGFLHTKKLIGVTPRLGTSEVLELFPHIPEVVEFVNNHGIPRGAEISYWIESLARNPVTKFIIIDDDSDMCHLSNHLVKTNWQTGLLDCHVEQAINKLLELIDV